MHTVVTVGLEIALRDGLVVVVGRLVDEGSGAILQRVRVAPAALVEEVLSADARVLERAGRGHGVGVRLGGRVEAGVPLQSRERLARTGRVVDGQSVLLVDGETAGYGVVLVGHSWGSVGQPGMEEDDGGEDGVEFEVHVVKVGGLVKEERYLTK